MAKRKPHRLLVSYDLIDLFVDANNMVDHFVDANNMIAIGGRSMSDLSFESMYLRLLQKILDELREIKYELKYSNEHE